MDFDWDTSSVRGAKLSTVLKDRLARSSSRTVVKKDLQMIQRKPTKKSVKVVAKASKSSTPRTAEISEFNPLTVGSDCAGLGAEGYALDQICVPYRIRFASEKDVLTASVLVANHDIECFYDTCCASQRPLSSVPEVDLYTAGPSCQVWSIQGNQEGFDSARGQLMHDCVEYIAQRRPKTFVLEQVKAIMTHSTY